MYVVMLSPGAMNKLAQVARKPEDWSCPLLDARMGELSLIKGELALEAPEELALTFEAPGRTACSSPLFHSLPQWESWPQ